MKSLTPRQAARATLAREVGYVRKPHGGRLRVALAFPNSYYVGMSNLGFQTAYRLFNEQPEVVCERVFLPPKGALRDGQAARVPLLTLESQSRVSDFDLFAFSVSFEWDYPNIVTLLRLAGIPVYARDRSWRHPLVVIGGAVTFLNPEPLAPFADVVAAGEGEALVPALVASMTESADRQSALRQLISQPGFYVPAYYTVHRAPDGTITGYEPAPGSDAPAPVTKAGLRGTEESQPPHTVVFTPDTEFGSRLLVEVVRGCANLCRFCWAGYNYLPVRAFPVERILSVAREARPHASRIGLVSIALCDHPQIEYLLEALVEMGYAISPASLRLDDLNETIVRFLQRSGERSVTIAPETGSDRLRRVINKTVTNAEILDKADLIFQAGIENLKLYYMIGLPTEDDADLAALRDLTLEIRDRMVRHGRARGRLGRIVASINPMIPKPGTAFQWLPLEDLAVLEAKAKRVRGLLSGIDNLQFSVKSVRHSFHQALLSLGDRRVAPVIEAVARNGGNWRSAIAEVGLDADFFVFRDRRHDAVLPWNIIDGGLKTSFFRKEFDRSLREEWTLPQKHLEEPSLRPLAARGESPVAVDRYRIPAATVGPQPMDCHPAGRPGRAQGHRSGSGSRGIGGLPATRSVAPRRHGT